MVQPPFATCAQTEPSVCDERSEAAWAHVVNGPIEQIDSPHPQTSSDVPALIRKPQWGKAWVSTTTLGQSVVATQSCAPEVESMPQPAPFTPASASASWPASEAAAPPPPPPPFVSC